MADRKLPNYRPLIIGVLIVFAIWMVVGVYLYRTGMLYYDAVVTELHICLHDTEYQPVQVVPASAQEFYLCGTVIGEGYVSAGFQLFRGEHFIARRSFKLGAGTFFIPVSMIITKPFKEVFEESEHRANVIFSQYVAAEVTFQIAE
jgi:hypothetical protein